MTFNSRICLQTLFGKRHDNNIGMPQLDTQTRLMRHANTTPYKKCSLDSPNQLYAVVLLFLWFRLNV